VPDLAFSTEKSKFMQYEKKGTGYVQPANKVILYHG